MRDVYYITLKWHSLCMCTCHIIANGWLHRNKISQILIKVNSKFQYDVIWECGTCIHFESSCVYIYNIAFILLMTLSTVNSKSIEINTGYVLYKESEKLCNEDRFSMSFMFYVNELIQRIDQLPIQLSNQNFWIPNVKLTENSGISLVDKIIIFSGH